MEYEQLRNFMTKYQCDLETALYYFDLRSEGCTREQAFLWCGLRDPSEHRDD